MTIEGCAKLADYLAYELKPDELVQFERHMSTCDACRTAISATRTIETLLRQAHDNMPVDEDWVNSVRDKLRFGKVEPSYSRTIRYTVAAAMLGTAASIAILWSASSLFKSSRDDTEPVSLRQENVPREVGPYAPTEPFVKPGPAVTALDGFLVTKEPQGDSTIEIYWVLPTQSRF